MINDFSKQGRIVLLKGTVSVISSDSSCKDDDARFTTVPLKPFSDQKCGRYRRFQK